MGIIVGGTIGGAAVVALAVGAVIYIRTSGHSSARVDKITEDQSRSSFEPLSPVLSTSVPTPFFVPPSKADLETMSDGWAVNAQPGSVTTTEGEEVDASTYGAPETVSGMSWLREEMQELRREVEDIRLIRQEPPPTYM